jgi:hypothetical protein
VALAKPIDADVVVEEIGTMTGHFRSLQRGSPHYSRADPRLGGHMADDLRRDVLPLPERKHVEITTYDAANAAYPDHQISAEEHFRIAMARQ